MNGRLGEDDWGGLVRMTGGGLVRMTGEAW